MPFHPVLNIPTAPAPSLFHCDDGKPPWLHLPVEMLRHHMGEAPLHRPVTRFSIFYEPDALNVLFQVDDRYVKSVTDRYQGPVYQDSCVEFFFSPSPSVDKGYFNLEINCSGAALFEFHPAYGNERLLIPEKEFKKLTVVSSMTGLVEPEITSPVSWQVAFRLPWQVLSSYTTVTKPEPGSVWRGNFHKCADRSSHPHWLTWAPIDHPTPRFHLPCFFGFLNFT